MLEAAYFRKLWRHNDGKKASWHAKKPAFRPDRMPASCRDRYTSVRLHPEITGTDLAEQVALEERPLECCAAVGGAQFVALWIGALYSGRDRSVANQAAWWDGFSAACL